MIYLAGRIYPSLHLKMHGLSWDVQLDEKNLKSQYSRVQFDEVAFNHIDYSDLKYVLLTNLLTYEYNAKKQ